jgi:hypothetical protein
LKAAKTIEPADHTLWAANEGANADIPRWNKVNGWIEMGGTAEKWDLFCPLPNDIVLPGQTFYVQFEARLAAGSLPSGLQAYSGVYDNTPGQRKYIEGGNFTISGEIFGIPGATSVDYQVLARTDSGEEALSQVLNFPNAPANFDQFNHPRISFSGVAGFIEFEIYRRIGTDYVHQFTVKNSIEGTYFDVGNPPLRVVSGFPTVTTTKPRAFAQTVTFAPGSLNANNFVRHTLTVFVPTTYNQSLTDPGQQYLRLGFTAFAASAGQLQIRKLGLSLGYGNWSRSANDNRSGVRSAPSTATTGLPGDSGGIDPNPPEPGGGGYCVLLERTTANVIGPDGISHPTPMLEVPRLAYLDNGGPVAGRMLYLKRAYASRLYTVRTREGYELSCTFDHPFITGWQDMLGTPASELKLRLDKGHDVPVLVQHGDTISTDYIASMTEEYGDFLVGMPVMEGSHICITNGILSHNLKPAEGLS